MNIMEDVVVRYINLPMTVRGIMVVDEDGNYNVYINSKLSSDRQRLALEHEMTHVQRGDFESFDDISDIEDID